MMTMNLLDWPSTHIEYRSQPAWNLAPNTRLQRTGAAELAQALYCWDKAFGGGPLPPNAWEVVDGENEGSEEDLAIHG